MAFGSNPFLNPPAPVSSTKEPDPSLAPAGTGGGAAASGAPAQSGAFAANPYLNAPAATGAAAGLGYTTMATLDIANRFAFPVLGLIGKIVQPVQSGQQMIFGAVSALEAFAKGQGGEALNSIRRARNAAAGFLTYGLLDPGDGRAGAITGKELVKNAPGGDLLPDSLATIGGVALDFFLDVPLVGQVGKAGRVMGLTRETARADLIGSHIAENLSKTFSDPGSLARFASGVMRAPLSTQPLREVVLALPQGIRQGLAERFGGNLERTAATAYLDPTKSRGGGQTAWPTLSEMFVSKSGRIQGVPPLDTGHLARTGEFKGAGLTDRLIKAQRREQLVAAQMMLLADQSVTQFERAARGFGEDRLERLKLLFDNILSAGPTKTMTRAEYDQYRLQAIEPSTMLEVTKKMTRGKAIAYDPQSGIVMRSESAPIGTTTRLVRNLAGRRAGLDLDALKSADPAFAGRLEGYMKAHPTEKYGAKLADPTEVLVHDFFAFPDKLKSALPEVHAALDKGDVTKFEGLFQNYSEYLNKMRRTAPGFETKVTEGIEELRQLAPTPEAFEEAGKALMWGAISDTFNARHLERVGALTPGTERAMKIGTANLGRALLGRPMKRADEAMLHQRTYYSIFDHPDLALSNIDANLPPTVDLDVAGLTRTFAAWQIELGVQSGPSARELANMLKGFYKDPSVKPQDAITDFFAQLGKQSVPKGQKKPMVGVFNQKGTVPKSAVTAFLKHVGDEWTMHQRGIRYQPPGLEVKRIMQDYIDRIGGVDEGGSSALELAAASTPYRSRQDLPDWWYLAADEVHDVARAVREQTRVAAKTVKRRGIVQAVYDDLAAEGAILHDVTVPDGPARAGFFRISETMARRLNGVSDGPVGTHGGAVRGTVFKEGMYVPRAHFRILSAAANNNDDAVTSAIFKWMHNRWKGWRVANLASITRDVGTNIQLNWQIGIQPPEYIRANAEVARLFRETMHEGGFLDKTKGIPVGGGAQVTMAELFSYMGDAVHTGFYRQEVKAGLEQAERLMLDPLGKGEAQHLARGFKAFVDEINKTRAGRALGGAASEALGLGGPVTDVLGDIKGMADGLGKAATYVALRRKGYKPEMARALADDVLFNYENVPLFTDFLRKNFIQPFATFSHFAAGRFVRSMYENPYAVARWYRSPNSQSGDEPQVQKAYAAKPFLKDNLYVPIPWSGRDGRPLFVNLGSFLPETALVSMFDVDNLSGQAPPALQVAQRIYFGEGFRGADVYSGGGSLPQAAARDPKEAMRGVLKELWRFGATPWAPGQPQTERLADAIVQRAVGYEDLPEAAQRLYDYVGNGPLVNAAESINLARYSQQSPSRAGRQPAGDPWLAALRAAGFAFEDVATRSENGAPGALDVALDAIETQIKGLDASMDEEMYKRGLSDDAKRRIRAEFDAKRKTLLKRHAELKRLRQAPDKP